MDAIEVEFKFRNAELKRVASLKDWRRIPIWTWDLLMPVLVLISLAWQVWLGLSWLQMGVTSVASLLAYRYFRKKLMAAIPSAGRRERRRRYTATSRREWISHSGSEIAWKQCEVHPETSQLLLSKRFFQWLVEPKRLFESQQLDQLRSWMRHPQDPPPAGLALYQSTLAQAAEEPIRLQYAPDDFANALVGLKNVTDADHPIHLQRQRWLVLTILYLVLAALVFMIWRSGFEVHTYMTLAILIPFLTLVNLQRLVSRWWDTGGPELPNQESQLMLLPDGWVVGDPWNVAFYDWRDVSAFCENRDTLLFISLDQAFMFPKRIFGGEEPAQAFLNRARTYHKRAQDRQEPDRSQAVEAVETGNPFQPPRPG